MKIERPAADVVTLDWGPGGPYEELTVEQVMELVAELRRTAWLGPGE
jgi:hypothetical protein